jgi:hypothetical protein
MSHDHCQAPDEWQHRQAKAAQQPSHFEPPPIWTRPAYSLERNVRVAALNVRMHINAKAEQAKDALFWGHRRS